MSKLSAKTVAAIVGLIATVAVAVPAHAETTKDRILKSKTVMAGIHNSAPWGYLTPDGKAEGFNVDVIRAVFQPLGVTDITFVTGDFGALIPGLLSHRFDVVDSGVVITPERCKLVKFADPELTSIDALLVKKGNPKNIHSLAEVAKNPAVKLGGSRGSQQAKNAELMGVTGDQLQLFQNTESTISAAIAGRVDGVTFTSGTANAILQKPAAGDALERAQPYVGPVKPDGSPMVSYIGTAFRLEDGDLRDLYSKRLAEMKADGTIAKIMAKYGFPPEETAPADLGSDDICNGKN